LVSSTKVLALPERRDAAGDAGSLVRAGDGPRSRSSRL